MTKKLQKFLVLSSSFGFAGSTFAGVAASIPTSVPTMSVWGLLALGGILAIIAVKNKSDKK